MYSIPRKYILDGSGNRTEVIISYEDFRLIEELLCLDFEENVISILNEASQDRVLNVKNTYVNLDEL